MDEPSPSAFLNPFETNLRSSSIHPSLEVTSLHMQNSPYLSLHLLHPASWIVKTGSLWPCGGSDLILGLTMEVAKLGGRLNTCHEE
jgi:hypothetical protein